MSSDADVMAQFTAMQAAMQQMNQRLELQQKQGEEILAQLNEERRQREAATQERERVQRAAPIPDDVPVIR